MNECVDDSIRFDSFAKTTPTPTSRRVSPASLPRPRSIDVLAPSRVSVSRVVVASSRRRIHPARPAADTDTENHEHTHTHRLERTSSTEDDSMSPTRDKKISVQ